MKKALTIQEYWNFWRPVPERYSTSTPVPFQLFDKKLEKHNDDTSEKLISIYP